jgi:hypothetical protein
MSTSSTRRRAVTSRCSSSPTTDNIHNFHKSDGTTGHYSHGTARVSLDPCW